MNNQLGEKGNQDLAHFLFHIAINTYVGTQVAFNLFSAYYVFLRERSYFISLDIKNLVNAICKEYTAQHNNKNSANPKGHTKGKRKKIIVFKAVLFHKVKKKSETVIMGILKVCGNWPITNFHSTVSCIL